VHRCERQKFSGSDLLRPILHQSPLNSEIQPSFCAARDSAQKLFPWERAMNDKSAVIEEIEITPEMSRAGVARLECLLENASSAQLVAEVYRAMALAKMTTRRCSPDNSKNS
jgi:hypothetical protein